MKYIIYLRVSTDQQTQSGLGLEAQREMCLRVIPAGSMVLEFADEGLSGALKMEKRPALMRAINELDAGDVLLISKRDRIGRDPIVNAMIERAVARKKSSIITASADVRDDDDPSSILMRRMVDAFSEYERLIIGCRTKVALEIKKNRGERVGHLPYGFGVDENGVKLIENKNEQENLRRMFDYRKSGMSLRKIAKEMNCQKYLNRGNSPWNHSSISRVMKGKDHLEKIT